MAKTLIYMADGKPVAALVNGESELNEGKLRRHINANLLRMATAQEIEKVTGAPIGFSGPVGLKNVPIFVDWDVVASEDLVTGANQKDKHLNYVNVGRDFQPTAVGDLRFVREGDSCAACQTKLRIVTSMEIGHIFKLGTRYTAPFEANFVDESGQRQHALMGCYGIGVNRVMAAIAEEHADEKGICWPVAVAPYTLHLITVNETDPMTHVAAEKLYGALTVKGVEVLYDNRNERAGVKFNDADLIGSPVQIILGEKNLKVGKIDFKTRKTGKSELVQQEEAVEYALTACQENA